VTATGCSGTYFTDNRGDEALGSTWSYLDLTARPPGRPGRTRPMAIRSGAVYWWNWHDEYDHPELAQGRLI